MGFGLTATSTTDTEVSDRDEEKINVREDKVRCIKIYDTDKAPAFHRPSFYWKR